MVGTEALEGPLTLEGLVASSFLSHHWNWRLSIFSERFYKWNLRLSPFSRWMLFRRSQTLLRNLCASCKKKSSCALCSRNGPHDFSAIICWAARLCEQKICAIV